MATIEEGYLWLNRNDSTDIGTVESILEDLVSEADPFIAERAEQALDFFKEVLGNFSTMRYDDSVREWRLPIYEPDSYDKKGRLAL